METISIIGFGKIGQAIGSAILNSNLKVIAVDLNPFLRDSFVKGTFDTNEPDVKDILYKNFQNGNLELTLDFSRISECQAIIVAIPLLVNLKKEINDEPFLDCFNSIEPYLKRNVVVSIETSIPVGYARSRILRALESRGKKHGIDFLLIHSPERIKSGSMMKQLMTTPKVIGGINEQASEKGSQIYCKFLDEKLLHTVKSIESAELIKLAGMVYRDINIAISNQLAQFSNSIGVDLIKLIELINSDNEANLLQPGIGVGGHCTPVYPYFLIKNFAEIGLNFKLAEDAREINDSMATYAVNLLKEKVKTRQATLLGLGFRANVKEDIFSTSYLLRNKLMVEGFKVKLYDPLYTEKEIVEKGFIFSEDLTKECSELLILVTKHAIFDNLDWFDLYKKGCRFFLDGRNAFDRKLVESAGIVYFGIGQ